MGMFMASLSFRKPEEAIWNKAKEKIHQWLSDIEGLTNNLDTNADAFAIVSPYGEDGLVLAESALPISNLIQGTVIMASCVDSDFNLLEVFENGKSVEKCYVGNIYEEYAEMMDCVAPNMDFWKTLLLDAGNEQKLQMALFAEEIFAEDNLRKLSELIGYPVFDDSLVFPEI